VERRVALDERSGQDTWRRGGSVEAPGVIEGNLQRTASFAHIRAGRIVEIHIRRLACLGDIEALNAEVFTAVRRVGSGAVICSDCRFAFPLLYEVADVWSRGMRGANRGVVRSGLLIDPANTMFNLQAERVVRCAGNPARRLFAKVDDLRDWVGEALPESERGALRDIFAR
jgi:hypothetical protein